MATAYMQTEKEMVNAYNYMNLALQISDTVCGKSSAESAAAYYSIGKMYRMKGDTYNAQNHFKVAEEILEGKEEHKTMLENIRKELLSCINNNKNG